VGKRAEAGRKAGKHSVRGCKGVVGLLQVPYCLFPQVQGAMAYQWATQSTEDSDGLAVGVILGDGQAHVSACS
jgi:hypothetical protein